jgi:hypothetical protein
MLAPLGLLALLGVLAMVSCAPDRHATATPVSASHALPTGTPTWAGGTYVDAKLGFRLQIPRGWRAAPAPGLHASAHNTAVTLIPADQTAAHSLIVIGVIGVFEGSAMPAAFTARGTPTTHLGSYPTFVADRSLREARVPCLVRILLAGSDYVLGTWCAMDALAHAAQFEQILATYQPAPSGYRASSTPPASPAAAPAPATCAQAQTALGYPSAAAAAWGQTLGTPTSTRPARGWGTLAPGAYVCSNDQSPDRYLFQCSELVNRYLYEHWALPHIPGHAARYFDYVQDGVRFPGVVRNLPAGTYQLSADASQGTSAFRPAPGDLLIFQDVQDPRVGWTSGLTNSPGHVAIITAVDASHVYLAQENYNDSQYFLALSLQTWANGYHIVDRSGLPSRIVRGWIRLTLPA